MFALLVSTLLEGTWHIDLPVMCDGEMTLMSSGQLSTEGPTGTDVFGTRLSPQGALLGRTVLLAPKNGLFCSVCVFVFVFLHVCVCVCVCLFVSWLFL